MSGKILAKTVILANLAYNLPDSFLHRLAVNPDTLLSTHDGSLIRGVSITKRSSEVDFVSRYFAPWNGIPEDPVNGSSHTNLAQGLGNLNFESHNFFC